MYWSLTRTVKERFDQGGVSIPFPQQGIHVINALQVNSHTADSKASASGESKSSTATSMQQAAIAGATGGNVNLGEDDV